MKHSLSERMALAHSASATRECLHGSGAFGECLHGSGALAVLMLVWETSTERRGLQAGHPGGPQADGKSKATLC